MNTEYKVLFHGYASHMMSLSAIYQIAVSLIFCTLLAMTNESTGNAVLVLYGTQILMLLGWHFVASYKNISDFYKLEPVMKKAMFVCLILVSLINFPALYFWTLSVMDIISAGFWLTWAIATCIYMAVFIVMLPLIYLRGYTIKDLF